MTVMIDEKKFRQALGRFTTGIAIATTCKEDGSPVGLTINSFNSVSLDPPMVLWSIGRNSPSRADFEEAGHFTINVLGSHQITLSNNFARPGDKFSDITWESGRTGAPVIPGCIATFHCKTAFCYEGGDHIIFVGEVENFDLNEGEPLLYLDGRYGVARPHPDSA